MVVFHEELTIDITEIWRHRAYQKCQAQTVRWFSNVLWHQGNKGLLTSKLQVSSAVMVISTGSQMRNSASSDDNLCHGKLVILTEKDRYICMYMHAQDGVHKIG